MEMLLNFLQNASKLTSRSVERIYRVLLEILELHPPHESQDIYPIISSSDFVALIDGFRESPNVS